MTALTRWLYLPDAYIGWISRITGVLSLPVAFVVWFYNHLKPFNVPAWKLPGPGNFLLDLPLPPEPVTTGIFVIYAVACLCLIAGKKWRPLYIYMASTLAYFCSREWFVCCFFWVLLNFCFLVALSLRGNSPGSLSPARRIIQITLATCYLFGVGQKIFFSDFWRGISLESFFHDGYAVTGPFKELLIQHPLPFSFWYGISIFLLIAETFIGLGLFFKRTRLAAVALGVILHGGIIVTMEPIIAIFSLEMWTGYLAFFDRQKAAATAEAEVGSDSASSKTNPFKTAVSLAFLFILIAVPARIYYLPGPPNDLLTLFDRTPWTFGMFLMRQKVQEITLFYDDAAGEHRIEPKDRIETISNDNELLALAQWVRSQNQQATSIRINSLIVVNERRLILKTLVWRNVASGDSRPVINVSAAGDYCRGAAGRSPDCDRHP